MKLLPKTEPEWLRFMATPFKAYIFGMALIYPFWYLKMWSGDYGIAEGLEVFTAGYAISFIALLLIAVFQMAVKRFREAGWTFIFAVVALTCGFWISEPILYLL